MTDEEIYYRDYTDESLLPGINKLASADLSEPYSVFTYRYFLHQWPELCICVYNSTQEMIGTIVGKAEADYEGTSKGYIAMLAVSNEYRKRGIGQRLVKMIIERMATMGCEEIVLETELTNVKALRLYERMGFMRVELLGRYYLNGGDAYRLKFFIVRPKLEVSDNESEAMAALGDSAQGMIVTGP